MKRRKLTRKQKAEIVQDQNGQCKACGSKLQVGEIEFDHREERRMAVDAEDAARREELSNFDALCSTCHLAKTAEWTAIHAKARRQAGETGQQARRRAGKTQKIESRGFDKRFKRKLDGTVVRRD